MAWDPSTDATATKGFTLADQILALVGDRAEALVTCGQGLNALTRFANSRIHQNMASDDDHVRLRVVTSDGRVAVVRGDAVGSGADVGGVGQRGAAELVDFQGGWGAGHRPERIHRRGIGCQPAAVSRQLMATGR